ncbi:MAG: DUF2911 domain-containing protein [Ekhidna sp.]
MKKILLLSLVGLIALSSSAQEFPAIDKSPMDAAYFPPRAAFRAFAKTDEEKKANQPKIRVVYSRPQKNGRKVFGELEKFGAVWRLGANEATEITFMQDVKIGDNKVKAGRYTMYAIPQADSWEVHFSTDNDGWGHYAYKPEESMVTKIKVETAKTESTVEAFSILFEEVDGGAHMIMAWDDTMVRLPIQF